jgi:hypothetical protein
MNQIGFVPIILILAVVGVVVYMILKPKTVAAAPVQVATPVNHSKVTTQSLNSVIQTSAVGGAIITSQDNASSQNSLNAYIATAKLWASQQGKAMVVLQVKADAFGVPAPASQGLGPIGSYAVTGADWNFPPAIMDAQYYVQVAGPFSS